LNQDIFDVAELALEPILLQKDLCPQLEDRITKDSPEIGEKMSSQDLIQVDFFSRGYDSVGIRKIVAGTVLAEAVAPLQSPQNEIFSLVCLSFLREDTAFSVSRYQ
jgi:hypothetical protein